ncbi:MAG TPA: Hpt domain-containing protein, partial [Nocardioides sp.]|nr:Hpt domain-containing protein [Nocardioides sp.]
MAQNDEDAEIIAEFLVESHENLDQLDRDLVELEQQPDSRERLSSIFRTIHTIKGTSGFLAFNRLEQLTHVGETLLSRLRDGEVVMTPPIAEGLLSMVDTVRALLEGIERTGRDTDPAVDVAPVVAVIEGLLAADSVTEEPDVSPAAPSATEPAPPVADEHWDGVERRVAVDATVRVDVDLLDDLVDLVGELVLTRNQLVQRSLGSADAELVRASQRLDLVASELQESIMKTRMQPIGQVWS